MPNPSKSEFPMSTLPSAVPEGSPEQCDLYELKGGEDDSENKMLSNHRTFLTDALRRRNQWVNVALKGRTQDYDDC
jgi:hypothetical protein